ncbi:hypothetical protein EZV73_06425 [Acidaminobacter sp. JC074]|uniref:hypothetical protein n=1 Tax=Acidaminobacter sp. JC074 TaxID=2530199 RepID=UPI001F10DD1B|nr:hypothetical protein [Acidaminobacter sp. JC074]MCH4887197.1 hypothetical protein [Acidaminobacter sp. JC074]
MKKIIIIIVCFLLVACQNDKKPPVKIIRNKPVVEVEETIEYVETDALKDLVKLVNKKTGVVDLMALHDLISPKLLDEVNLNKNIDDQMDLIDEIILESLTEWKKDKVQEVLIEENLDLNQDDIDTLVEWASCHDAYKVMSVYEVVYLKEEAKK